MSRSATIRALAVLAFSLVIASAHAQSSLGIGTNDAITPSTGLFAGFTQWVNVHQQQFYRALTGALKAMRDDGGKMWLLVGLSFAYGVFHAAGPGHGKAVISSYMLANEVALRRGITLAFISAFLQGITALVVMGLVFLVLRRTAISMTDATWFLEVASYGMITLFGAWLLWKKAAPKVKGLFLGNPAVSLSSAQTHFHTATCTHPSHFSASGFACESCGHSHMADPALLSGDRFDWRTAWTAVAAVGLRPCTGAIIVLSFAFLNELWLGGVLSVAAMSLGTAMTVSALAIVAVTAKNWAVTAAGDGRVGNTVHAAIEIGGAAFVMLLGLMLLVASLNA
ncbi:MAG: nickel/cobalt transporter [Rhizobiaceae bacterium]|nr:nickel/cobalt transporter [Rhizobiaceae bacterium]